MVRFLIRTAIHLLTAALGLLIASWLLPDFRLEWGGFLVAIVVFAIMQGLVGALVVKLTRRFAAPLLGGVGLITTFLSLFVATLFPGGIHIRGLVTWVLATLLVWAVTALGGWVLPLILLKEKAEDRK